MGVKNVLPDDEALQQDHFVSGRVEDEEGNFGSYSTCSRTQFFRKKIGLRDHMTAILQTFIRKQTYHEVEKEGYERRGANTRRNRKNLVVQLKRKKEK